MGQPLVNMQDHKINASIQIVPLGGEEHYHTYFDAAIAVIQQSGLKHMVSPMETVIEGPKAKVMEVLEQAREAALSAGAIELLVNIKLHLKGNEDVTFEEKIEKFN